MNEFGDNLLVKLVTFEYKHEHEALSVRLVGNKANALSPKYFETFNSELEYIRTIIKDLAGFVSTNFVIEAQVNKDGKFNCTDIKCTFIKALNRGGKNKQTRPLADVFHLVEKVLPFAEYMYEVHLYSYQYSLCNFEVRMNVSLDDIKDVFSYPFIAPRSRQQWLDAMVDFDNYTKNHYSCSCCLPVVDGELEREDMMYTLSAREIFRRVK